MDYELTVHARQRMKERSIAVSVIEQAITNPTKILIDAKGIMLIKKLVILKSKQRLLLIAGQVRENKLKIFTVIDTSKVKKYL